MKSIFSALVPYGFEQEIVDDDFEVVEPYTEIFPIQPCFKPAFDFKQNKWIETASDEELTVMHEDRQKSLEAAKEQEKLRKEQEKIRNELELQRQAERTEPIRKMLTNAEVIEKLKEFPLYASVTMIIPVGWENGETTIDSTTSFRLEGGSIEIV